MIRSPFNFSTSRKGENHVVTIHNKEFQMAKTIRRKNHKYNYSWVLRSPDWILIGGMYQRIPTTLDRHSKAGKKALAEYHADGGFGSYGQASAPHWYRRMLNKKATNKEKNQLDRWVKDNDFEVPKPVRVGDASWYW
jgi:hypothetical protein